MTLLLILLTAATAALVWVLASPVRIATAIVVAFITHPTLTVWLTAALALCTLGVAVVLIYRNVAGTGWRLVTVSYAPVGTDMEATHG